MRGAHWWCVSIEVRSAGSVGSGLVSRLCVCAFVGRVVRDGCEVRLCDPRLPRCLLLVCFVFFSPVLYARRPRGELL